MADSWFIKSYVKNGTLQRAITSESRNFRRAQFILQSLIKKSCQLLKKACLKFPVILTVGVTVGLNVMYTIGVKTFKSTLKSTWSRTPRLI